MKTEAGWGNPYRMTMGSDMLKKKGLQQRLVNQLQASGHEACCLLFSSHFSIFPQPGRNTNFQEPGTVIESRITVHARAIQTHPVNFTVGGVRGRCGSQACRPGLAPNCTSLHISALARTGERSVSVHIPIRRNARGSGIS